MSDITLSEVRPGGEGSARRPGLRVAAVLAIAVLLALAAALAAFSASQTVGPYLAIPLAAAALCGLLALAGLMAGFVQIGWMPQQRAFLDSVANAIGDACAVTDQRGRVVYCNQAYRDHAQRIRPGRLVGVENLYAGVPEASEAIYRLAQNARDRFTKSEEFRVAGEEGTAGSALGLCWLKVSVAPVNLAGSDGLTLWRIEETTDARKRQEKAFTNLQFIINYLDNAPAGFFSTTSDGRIAYLNATLADWLGLDIATTTNGTLKLADVVGEGGALSLAAIKPEPGRVKTEVFDIDLEPQGTSPIPVRIVHRTDFDEEGRVQPSRSLVLDRRHGAEAADNDGAAEIRLARFVNNAPIGVAEIGPDGVIHHANPAFLRMAGGKLIGAKLEEIVSDEHREAVRAGLGGAASGAGGEPVNVGFRTGDDHTGQLYFCGAGEADKNGLTAVYAIDTTEHSSLESQLAQSQKMQAVGALAGGVAHDFNNVLTAILGFSELLLAKHRPSDPAFADIMNIKQNANRAANLVRQLLAFSRRQTLRPQVLSLTDALSDLGILLGRLLGETVELNMVHGRDVGLVKVDVNQFEQVVINLAVNARDAMPQGGTLTVKTSNVEPEEAKTVNPGVMPEGRYVLLEIRDTGEGMPPEVVAKMYEPFFSTKEVGKGTGLGLSTVYGIIKQTGGFIFCDSEPGRGTAFRIYLPRHFEEAGEASEAGGSAKPAEKPREDLTGHGTILLVEDEDAVRSFASRALGTRGYTVLEADSGEAALEVINEHGGKIDLILSDVVMPEMDGPSLLNELRKRGISTKVVFISGYAEDAFEKNLEGHDDFAFLPKPFSLKQLAEAVKKAMDS